MRTVLGFKIKAQRGELVNLVNYVEFDGHMALLDETGGKPLTGYGPGANTGSPVATAEESAAMLFEAADTLERDFNDMCLGGGYALGGDFCQSVTQEGLASRRDATVLAQKPSLRNIARDGVVLGQWSAANWDTLVTIGCGVAAAGFSGGTAAFAAARACAVTMTTYSALRAAQSHSVEDQTYAALGLLCFIAGERAKRGKAAADACGTALDSIAIKGSLHDLAERLSAQPRLANPYLDPASRKGG